MRAGATSDGAEAVGRPGDGRPSGAVPSDAESSDAGAELRAAGLEALDWLCAVQTAPDGRLRLIGSEGYGRPGEPARFAQQPLDAWGMVEASLAARRLTGEPRWRAEAVRAHAWFLGANDAGTPLADPAGACRDGIDPQGASVNRGAESTLAWLHADAALRLDAGGG